MRIVFEKPKKGEKCRLFRLFIFFVRIPPDRLTKACLKNQWTSHGRHFSNTLWHALSFLEKCITIGKSAEKRNEYGNR